MNLGNKINLGSSAIKVGFYWQKYLFKTAVHTASSIIGSDQISYSFFFFFEGGRQSLIKNKLCISLCIPNQYFNLYHCYASK